MVNSRQIEGLKKALEEYGQNAQLHMVVEECLELASILHKKLTRSSGIDLNDESIISEIADVILVIETAKIIFNRRLIRREIEAKVNRLVSKFSCY